jgi:predicted HNH restriction endonuclease
VDRHHLVYRSEARKHPNLNDERNLVFLCRMCHNSLHEKKSRREPFIKERRLWELFPVLLQRYNPDKNGEGVQ